LYLFLETEVVLLLNFTETVQKTSCLVVICVAEVGFLPSVLLKTVYKCQTWRLLKGVILVILMDFS